MSELLEILKFYKEIGAEFVEHMELEFDEEQQVDPRAELEAVQREIMGCSKCELHKSKKNYVPGEGSSSPDIIFIGEGPGEVEDNYGRPFVGPA